MTLKDYHNGFRYYKGVRYYEIEGAYCIDRCHEKFSSVGEMMKWIEENCVWACPRDAGG
jgi:hypothetical protein